MTDQQTPEPPKYRSSPRELGKQAYREGLRPDDNPFQDGRSRTDWSDGWGYQRTHYPSAKDVAEAAADLDCMSPWQGDESGYGAYC